MKFIIKKTNKIFFFFLIILILKIQLTLEGIIEPDDILPLEISPSYESEIGKQGTQFIFRFFIPKNVDKNGMPTFRGYGAGNGQYIGIQFNIYDSFDVANIRHSCLMTQLENNLNIPLTAENSGSGKIIYCKITSFDNTHLMFPGYNYKLTITMLNEIPSLNNLISITIFTTSCPELDSQIFDIGTFNHINIFPPYLNDSSSWPIASLEANGFDVEVGTYFNFTAKVIFEDWFSWDDYIICLNLPKEEIILDNPTMKLSSPNTANVPVGSIHSINLESDEERKYIGFYLDGSKKQNEADEQLSMTFSGLKIKEAGSINGQTSNNNNIEIQIRYRNSYVVCANKKIEFKITLGTVKFEVKHPETTQSYTFDVFQGGAFQIEFTINVQKNVDNKYFFIKQMNSNSNQKVTFIASSCDFSNFNIDSQNFNDRPKCHPIKNTNKEDGEDNFNGIFFYYPNTIKANVDYKLRVWIFFDICIDNSDEHKKYSEIQFKLEIHNKINKNKFGQDRIQDSYIFFSQYTTEGIKCFTTNMGEKNYYNGYLFSMSGYSNGDLLYREYFDWNIYDPENFNFENIYLNEDKQKFIYSNDENHQIKQGNNLLLMNKIILDSGNNEKLGQFFPMGLWKNEYNKIYAKEKFFIKLSNNFFDKNIDSNGNNAKCYVSWAFGSPSITDELKLDPTKKYYPPQNYNYITNSEDYFGDPTVLLKANINNNNIKSSFLESDEITNYNGEWSFGDEENLEDQISDDSPVEIYFGLSDTCHHWRNLSQTINSLYTPIEIIVGFYDNTRIYSRVMRFIKLFPEGGVWHDNIIKGDGQEDIFIRSNDFIIKNHFAYNKVSTDENDPDEKGVCLLEIMSGILDSRRYLSNNFFLWIFMGSLLDTDYEQIYSTYPVGNLPKDVNAYGYSSQHSLNPNNFYAKPSDNQKSDITSPIYNIATSMNSIHQSASSGYLFYLGSLIILDNRVKTSSFYDKPNSPLIIPYYCPYYHTKGDKEPYSFGIFPSFIAGFGSFKSMTDFGNRGFDKLVAKKINKKQLNVLMLSGIKIYDVSEEKPLKYYYNTVKFINDYSNNLNTLDVWNCNTDFSLNDNEYDSIDSFIFFFNEKIMTTNTLFPEANIPNQLKSLTKTKKNDNFYVYGKKFIFGIFGITNSDLLLTRNTPNSKDKTPYLSINLKYEIPQKLLKCESSEKYCPNDLIAYWGISSNHDMIRYVSNYKNDNYFFLDYNIYRTYANKKPSGFESILTYKNDLAIYLKFTFYSPFNTAVLANTILSFKIKRNNEIQSARCSVQSQNFNLPSSNCNTDELNDIGNIECELIDSSMKYDIFCYKLDYGSSKFTLAEFKLKIPNDNSDPSLIFEDNDEYPIILLNSNNDINNAPSIEPNYITKPYNYHSYTKLELAIDMKRPAYPGMKIKITYDGSYDSFVDNSECIFSLSRINTYSMNDIDMNEYWNKGNSIIYYCKIEKGISEVTIEAKLDDKIYTIGKDLSTIAYIYIWPFRADKVPTRFVSLSVINNNDDKNILSLDGSINNIRIINSQINGKESIQCNDWDNNYSLDISSKIYGDLSDYTFSFKASATISSVQLFFPKEISFECEECVKCYHQSDSGEFKMTTCNFEDYNILNIALNNYKNEEPIIVTGIINPRDIISASLKIYFNLINIDSDKNKYSFYSCSMELTNDHFKSNYLNVKIQRLRFFYLYDAILDKNPRKKTSYQFSLGIDYANNYETFQFDDETSLYIYFPRDYHLYINSEIQVSNIKYNYKDKTQSTSGAKAQILGRKIKITLNDGSTTGSQIKMINFTIYNIQNPNKIISITENINRNKYTGFFKIVYLSDSDSDSYKYYITGINSNTYRSDYITDENLRSNEFNWYRGNLIQTDYNNRNKLILDVLNNEKNYNFIFLQPGRYIKAYFVTSSDNENASEFYLNPNWVSVSFQNSIVKTLEDKYIIPSLFGEPFEFYIGVPCSTNEGIYVVSPSISNKEQYIDSPSIIINVRQIESATIAVFQDSIGIAPPNSKYRIYYYLSDINVDTLQVSWIANYIETNSMKKAGIENIHIPEKTYSNINKRISNVFSSAYIKKNPEYPNLPNDGEYYFIGSTGNNNCYKLSPDVIYLKENSRYEHRYQQQNFKLSNDLIIKNADNDANLLSNEIKFEFTPSVSPYFIFCEIYCQYNAGTEDNKLDFYTFEGMNSQLNSVNQNYFRKYTSYYFRMATESASLTFYNVIKGYQYNAQCIYQSTQSDDNLVRNNLYTLTSEKLHSSYPAKTRCNTFYFVSPINEEIQQKYINYCQYIIGKICGNEGCIVCSDPSGKIIPPGFSLYFPFNCQSEKCYDKSNSSLIDEMYRLSEEFNSGSKTSKYEFTICATSNRICSTQIKEQNFNSAFNQFVNNIKTTESVNKIFNIDYNDINYIIYNGYYQNAIFIESNLKENDIQIEFVSELNKDGNAIWKGLYNSEVNFNILCFWRVKISTDNTPTMEEMTNCLDGDSFCGICAANYGGHEYQIPDYKRSNVVVGVYTLYITCSYFVPSPIYFTPIKDVKTIEIKEEETSFSGKIINIKYINLLLFLIILF